MTYTPGNTQVLQTSVMQQILAHLDRNTVMRPWANRKYEGELRSQGQTVRVPVLNDFNTISGGTGGSSIAAQDTAMTYADLTVSQVEQMNRPITNLEELRTSYNTRSEYSDRIAYAIAQQQERHIGLEAAMGVNANNITNSAAPAAVTDAFVTLEAMRKTLSKNNAMKKAAAFINPAVASLLRQNTNLFNGFAQGLDARKDGFVPGVNGYVGKVSGFDIYETNNLPTKVQLDATTQVTADDTMTFTLYNFETEADVAVLFTFKAVPSAAGEIDLGADAAATQANIVLAINGTGTPSATTYIDLSASDRALMKNYQVTCGTFATGKASVYAKSGDNVTFGFSFTAAGEGFETKGIVLLAWDMEAVNFVDQMTKFKIKDGEDGFFDRLLSESVFQGDVLGRNGKRIAAVETTTA